MMNRKFRIIFAVASAFVLVFALSVPALAASNNQASSGTNFINMLLAQNKNCSTSSSNSNCPPSTNVNSGSLQSFVDSGVLCEQNANMLSQLLGIKNEQTNDSSINCNTPNNSCTTVDCSVSDCDGTDCETNNCDTIDCQTVDCNGSECVTGDCATNDCTNAGNSCPNVQLPGNTNCNSNTSSSCNNNTNQSNSFSKLMELFQMFSK
ncbi:hypothetical protein LJC42_04410 [Eubacteriales bacterium OttesenSCG-928-K08]|nr:hypothetical protein [Eubacteriales bacterium OttesenSCG-928-K08]